jgi:DNA (cytosine-5)-methyltransferase 1
MNVLDLFSGIGGFSLGLERAGMRTVAFCEIGEFQRAVLAKHWPGVPCYDDVRTLSADRLRADGISVDVICGGFPCQDISLAGKGAGLAGERSGLWREYARLIGELRPRFVLVENVSALLGRGLGDVLGDLAALRYDAEWHCIPASCVGLPHIRDRVWIVADDRSQRKQGFAAPTLPGLYGIPWSENERRAADWRERSDLHPPYLCGRRDGVSERLDALGNAVAPQIPEAIGRAIMNLRLTSALHEGE